MAAASDVRGREAERPREIPSRGWLDIARRVKRQMGEDRLSIIAAGMEVVGDIVAVARNRIAGVRAPTESNYADLRIRPMGEVVTRYHVSLDVADKAGVLASVAGIFARHNVSIQTVRQEGRGADATLVVVTHSATDAALAATVEELRALDIVRGVTSVMRVEGE